MRRTLAYLIGNLLASGREASKHCKDTCLQYEYPVGKKHNLFLTASPEIATLVLKDETRPGDQGTPITEDFHLTEQLGISEDAFRKTLRCIHRAALGYLVLRSPPPEFNSSRGIDQTRSEPDPFAQIERADGLWDPAYAYLSGDQVPAEAADSPGAPPVDPAHMG